jgi:hypothetical protein
MTTDEFVRRHLEQYGKTSYTLEEVERLVIEYRKEQAAAAAPLRSDAAIDALLGIVPQEQQPC